MNLITAAPPSVELVEEALPMERVLAYRLRTVRIGLESTALVLVALGLYLVSLDEGFADKGLFLATLVAAAVGGAVIAALPWRRLFGSAMGIRAMYVWSVMDILLITVLIETSGGANSPLFVLYGLTTVFFAASYPPRAQFVLLLFTIGCFALASEIGSGDFGTLAIRSAILGIITYLSSFLSRELITQSAELRREMTERAATSRRLGEAKMRERQALELNDNVVQGLATAKISFELGEYEEGMKALERTLIASRDIVSDLLGEEAQAPLGPGHFRRATPGKL